MQQAHDADPRRVRDHLGEEASFSFSSDTRTTVPVSSIVLVRFFTGPVLGRFGYRTAENMNADSNHQNAPALRCLPVRSCAMTFRRLHFAIDLTCVKDT